MGCCNQVPKGGTGKLSYLLGLMALLFVVILLLAAFFG
ncbi:membrane protein [Vibrio harveyi]|nr:membrane protein [Vibrio harveyi]